MRSPQSHSRSVPGWPPIWIGCCAAGRAGQSPPWSSSVPVMVALSYSPRDFVVGAANAHTSAAVRPMNWSATTSSLPGAPLPSHCAEAWNAVHPFGTVTEYPYVSDANVTCGDSDGVGDVTVLAEGVD